MGPEVCAFARYAGRNQIALFTAAGRRAEADGGSPRDSRGRESYSGWFGSIRSEDPTRETCGRGYANAAQARGNTASFDRG